MAPVLIPQANPGAGYRARQAEIDAAVARVLGSGWYVLGAEGRGFEAEFAAWLGTARAVGCGNGTDALALALRGLGIGPGCTVATVSHTAVATVAAIEMAGAMPLLIDIDPAHYTLDPGELAAVLAQPPAGLPPVRAVIPVHLYGQAADLDAIGPVCARHGVALIEDCARRMARRCTTASSAGSARRPVSPSIRPRISARWAMAGSSPRTTRHWRSGWRRCGNMAGDSITSATRSA